MKNFTNVKLKIFLLILISISLILQPVCIYFYITNKFSYLDILKHEYISIIFILSLAIIINEQIFMIIFYHMLKGKLIKNKYNIYNTAASFIILLFLLIYWSLFMVIKDYIYPYIFSITLIPLLSNMRQNYIISNGFILNGFTVIPIESIQWYKTKKVKRTRFLYIRYNGNRKYCFYDDPSMTGQLIEYFDTHNIPQRNQV